MSRYERINPYRAPRSPRGPWRRRFSAALPWVFVFGVAAGTMLPVRHWVHWPFPHRTDSSSPSADSPAARDAEMVWKRAGSPDTRHPVDVIRTVDGDTFEARVHVGPGLDPTTGVRLRGIDAPELKASCPEELQKADVATRHTQNVSSAMLAAGHARSYQGGHRSGWCANANQVFPK